MGAVRTTRMTAARNANHIAVVSHGRCEEEGPWPPAPDPGGAPFVLHREGVYGCSAPSTERSIFFYQCIFFETLVIFFPVELASI